MEKCGWFFSEADRVDYAHRAAEESNGVAFAPVVNRNIAEYLKTVGDQFLLLGQSNAFGIDNRVQRFNGRRKALPRLDPCAREIEERPHSPGLG